MILVEMHLYVYVYVHFYTPSYMGHSNYAITYSWLRTYLFHFEAFIITPRELKIFSDVYAW